MPKEVLNSASDKERIGPPEVYTTLRDLIALQFEARGFSFLPKYAVQTILSGRHRSKLRGRGLDFDEVRKYVAGDDIRNIDWRVTARVGQTHTKVYTEEKERPVFLIVDQSSSMFFGSRLYMKSVIAAHLAAVGCWRVMDQGDRVGGIVFNDEKINFVSPKRDRRSIQRFLSFISEQNQELKATAIEATMDNALNKAIQQAHQVVTHDFLVFVISDFNEADDFTLKELIRIKRNNDVILAHVSDPSEMEISSKNITISDGSYQIRLDKDRTLKKKFKADQVLWLEKANVECKKYGIPFLSFHTEEEASKQLRSMLGERQRRTK
jgi:uncharacterized protein (DUF58 family)